MQNRDDAGVLAEVLQDNGQGDHPVLLEAFQQFRIFHLPALRSSPSEAGFYCSNAQLLCFSSFARKTERAGFRDDIGLSAALRVEPACCRFAAGVFSSRYRKEAEAALTERAGFEPAVGVVTPTTV